MEPTQKDIHGKAVFFNRINFQNMTDKYKLHSFPLQWSTGRENLRNYEWDTNDQIKVKNGWESSQANYQFIQTNKPDNTIDSLTKNVKGENCFWNQSNCYLNTISDIDLGQVLNLSQEETNNMPYLRLMTKNLVLEFDWLKLITTRFASSLPHTALAHKHLALATNKAAWAQYHQAEEYKYHTLTQDSALEKMIDTAVKKARIYALDQNISEDQVTDQQLREAATKEAHIQKEQMQQKKVHYQAEKVKNEQEMRDNIAQAQTFLQEAQQNKEPVFGIELLSPAIIKGPKQQKDTVFVVKTTYQKEEWLEFLKQLNLAPTDDLSTSRAYILDNHTE